MLEYRRPCSQRPRRPARARGPARQRKRRGSLLVEVGIATIVLMMVMGLMVKVLATVARERRAAEARQRGVLEVANLMERITARRFDEVTPELARKMALSESARQSLRDSELTIEVSGSNRSAAPAGSPKRVMIHLRWRGSSGQWQAPVRLTSWIEPRRARS